MPIRKDDEAQVVRGRYKGQQMGEVAPVNRRTDAGYTHMCTGKANGPPSMRQPPQQGGDHQTKAGQRPQRSSDVEPNLAK
ncbi:hypothetical protein QTO34_015010 [Cnephaeus nilssonii]|uniref:Uncharacterized protein n=1 Tax=Cnephaeus nilssonii TaxID=3371016 RepID=A0AA40LSP9_CNENI|nr:hypothetical protein QTO34_015010 [Eptesicus nilssonii]